jgi:hypothetical protein
VDHALTIADSGTNGLANGKPCPLVGEKSHDITVCFQHSHARATAGSRDGESKVWRKKRICETGAAALHQPPLLQFPRAQFQGVNHRYL